MSTTLRTNGEGNSGDITINANDRVNAAGVDREGVPAGIFSSVNQGAEGNAGNINVQAGAFSLEPGAIINTSTSGQGNAGNITIDIDNAVSFVGANIFSNVERGAVGNGGQINLSADSLSLEDGGQLQTLVRAANEELSGGQGNAGNITIDIDNAVSLVGGDIFSTIERGAVGNGGQIDITAGSLSLEDGAQLQTLVRAANDELPGGQGNAGSITVNVAGDITLAGSNEVGVPSGIFSVLQSGAVGQAGDINLTGQSLSIFDEGILNSGSFGRGDGGNINIATDSLVVRDGGRIISGTTSGESNQQNQGGDINIIANSLSLIDRGSIVTRSSGVDVEPGDINIQVRDATVIEAPQNSDSSETPSSIPLIGSILLEDSTGRSGNIFLETGSLTIKDGGQIASASGGRGDGGNIRIQVADKICLEGIANTNLEFNEQDILGFNLSANAIPSGIASSALSQQGGNGGNIEIAAGSLEIFEGAQILSTALGEGNAGNIDLNIRGDITLSGTTPIILNDVPGNSSSVIQSFLGLSNLAGTGETSGNTGNITIEANSLSLSDTAAISNTTFTRGNAGKIVLQIDDTISLSQGSFIDSSISPGGSGEGGDIEIQTRTLSLTDGSTLFAGLTGELFGLPAARGRGGNITIQASDSITISGFNPNTVTGTNFLNPSQSEIVEAGLNSSGIFVGTSEGTTGNPGTITLTTGDLRLADGGIIQASTGNNSIAGDITINADSFEALNGGQILAVTESSGNGGNINLSIAEELKISGSDSSFAERIAQFPDNVINQGAESAILALATAEATGSGGNISISSGELNILDNGRITVDSKGQGNGGTVSITADDLTLDGEAFISASTTAGAGGEISLIVDDSLILRNNSQITAQAFGTADGGNINIDTNFIVAFPSQNDGNDILASAERGRGGNININAESLFGIEERSLNPFSNDINASSEVFGLEGTVTINSPDLNPIQGASELPSNVVESRQTTAQACQTNREVANKNELVIKGKGGIPDAPDLPLNSHNIFINGEHANPLSATPQPILTSIGKIQPARGIKVTKDGRIILTAYPTNNQGERLPQGSINCGQV